MAPSRATSAFALAPLSGRRRRCQSALRMSLDAVKVCGIVSREDAAMVARVFREEMPPSVRLSLGMIVWPGSRRSVDRDTARGIAAAALEAGATPVGVFVDETADAISAACLDIGVHVAQLHGPKCRQSVRSNSLPASLSVVDVVDVAPDGSFADRESEGNLDPLWKLYDAKGGGTGRAFDWARFVPPPGRWFLAGGLNPENVGDAVRVLRPSGLDVASGVAGADGCAKDERLLRAFLRQAWVASNCAE
jgi:phosphoribosylanthranilate isomerase